MRLIKSFRKRLAWLLWPTGYGVVRREGALFLVNLRHWAEKTLVTSGIFEREQLSYLLENINRRGSDAFIDIGANMGAYSIFVALRTRCKTIIAYEPDRRSIDRLRANALLNGLSGTIESHAVAVSSSNGTVPFTYGPDSFDAISKVADGPNAGPVACVSLDEVVRFSGKQIVLKIDIEGHEGAALLGMRNLLSNNRCFIQVECFDENFAAAKATLESLGYRLVHEIGIDRYFEN
jgi:FkbM family methyltransferase